MPARRSYPSDPTDAEWAQVAPLPPRHDPRAGGRPLGHERRSVVDAILCVLRSGCAWRMVPHDPVPWWVAHRRFAAWAADGTRDAAHDALRERVRLAEGRQAQPSAGVLDARSVKTAEGGAERGHDAGKKAAGRKRHLLADTTGLVLVCAVHSASVQGRAGGRAVLAAAAGRFPRLAKVWADGGCANAIDDGLLRWARDRHGLDVEVVRRPEGQRGFSVLPRRWVVERTFAWLGRCRRLARDYERKPAHAEAMVKVATIRLVAARLAGEDDEPRGPYETEAARRLAEAEPDRPA